MGRHLRAARAARFLLLRQEACLAAKMVAETSWIMLLSRQLATLLILVIWLREKQAPVLAPLAPVEFLQVVQTVLDL
jgi:hypothetical protein